MNADGIGPVLRGVAPQKRKRKGAVKAGLARLQPGEAFDFNGSRNSVQSAARRLGVRITTEQIAAGLVRVWRID